MTQACKCDEAQVHRRIRRPSDISHDLRFEFDPDPALSAVAAAAHSCSYVRSRNAKIGIAEEHAHAITRAELAGESFSSPKYQGVWTTHFHAEMARLMGTPHYRERSAS